MVKSQQSVGHIKRLSAARPPNEVTAPIEADNGGLCTVQAQGELRTRDKSFAQPRDNPDVILLIAMLTQPVQGQLKKIFCGSFFETIGFSVMFGQEKKRKRGHDKKYCCLQVLFKF